GLACGCSVVASAHGGLPEAVGPHGVLFEPGNAIALADAILAADRAPWLLNGVTQYLSKHQADYVAGRYLEVLEAAIAEVRSKSGGKKQPILLKKINCPLRPKHYKNHKK